MEQRLEIEQSRDQITSTVATIKMVRSHVSDLRGLLGVGTASERRELLSAFVEEVITSDTEATIRYSVPVPDNNEVGPGTKVLGLVTSGGAGGTRTPDPLNAIEVLSQLSYSPGREKA